MRRALMLLGVLLSGAALVACGGSAKKGDKGGDDRTAFDKLQALPGELDAELASVTKPIDDTDMIIEQLASLPEKAKLSKEDFSKLIVDTFQGKPFQAPANIDATAAAELEGFLTNLAGFKDSLMGTPDAVAALSVKAAETLVNLPILTTQVATEAAVVKANPFASKEDKAKAAQQEAQAKDAETQANAKVSEIQTKVGGLPARTTAALGKFSAAMGSLGLADAAMGAVTDKVDEAKGAGEDMKKTAEDSAGKSVDTATQQ